MNTGRVVLVKSLVSKLGFANCHSEKVLIFSYDLYLHRSHCFAESEKVGKIERGFTNRPQKWLGQTPFDPVLKRGFQPFGGSWWRFLPILSVPKTFSFDFPWHERFLFGALNDLV